MKRIDEKTVRSALERRLSGLAASPALSARIRQRIAQEEEPKMKKKLSLGLVLAVVLILGAVSAVASGLVFSRRVDDAALAGQALEKAYGVTPTMQGTYFSKTVEEGPEGTTVTYWGIEDLRFVLGEYTVTLKDGKAAVTWSHDGESTAGGFDADAWGVEQMKAMLDWEKEHHDVTGYYGKAVEAIQRNEAADRRGGVPSAEEIQAVLARQEADAAAAKAAARLTEQDMAALAREAVATVYELSDAQMALLKCAQDIDEEMNFYSLQADKPVYNVWFSLQQELSDDPAVFPPFTEKDGQYWVSVNVETGVIESTQYDTGLGGNG
ncbi:MAG: hypothetical protein GX637_02715 [Clostridiales bacterium]|nr:hypothetical protein [Clostridiales bacterium]